MFFGDYRFSVDLDFSAVNGPKGNALKGNAPKGHEPELALQDAINISRELLSQYGPFEIQLKRFPERAPHPTGQEAFNITVKFPWHRSTLCTIKIEITHDEPVLAPPEYKTILHGYDEILDCRIATYRIEEIIAEKMRALLQTHQKLVTRGWNRPRARDYYDLWSILKHYSSTINYTWLVEILDKKCLHRHISYETLEDFFTTELTEEAHQHWQTTLGNLVIGLPECELVLNETKSLIERVMTTNEIKKRWFKLGQQKINILTDEVISLAVKIKIFASIADAKKRNVIKYEHDPFWGWLQGDCIFRSVVVDGLKLYKDSFKHLNSVLIKGDDEIISKKQYGELRKKFFRKGLDRAFKDCIGHLEEIRDKRLAHLENVEVENVSCDLQDLLLVLADLLLGLNAIQHFLSNPTYIIYEQWDMFRMPENEDERLKVFIFETYPHIQSCVDILKSLEGQQEAEDFSL
jgi:predicted nucleotidyltransferase component of viral defense system